MKNRNAKCSFCRKSYRVVGPLVEGSGNAYICGECIELSQSIIRQEKRRRSQSAKPEPSAIEPDVLLAKLNQLVSGQDQAKHAFAQAAVRRTEGIAGVLLVGPASSGIFLARALAHVLDVPFALGTASELLPSQSHHQQVPAAIYKLLLACDFDVESAKDGVVYLGGAEHENEQRALLRLWQEKVVSVGGSFEVDTRQMLFICGGSFAGLDQAIARSGRHAEQPITGDTLIGFGAQPEWVRQLQAIARVTPIDDETLTKIAACFDFSRLELSHSGNANRGA
jgi:ATP-dependent Clp protease ATP-binding subunit ClpX